MDGGNWCILSTYLGMVYLGMCVFFVIDFARIWTYVDPGKFMVYFCLLSFLCCYFGYPILSY